MDKRIAPLALVLLAALAVLTAVRAAETATAAPPTALVPIRNARVPLDGVLSGGQPTPEQIRAAAGAGYRTVINLRSEQETGYEWEAQLVEKLGMRYVHVPVAGAGGLTPENVERIDAALREAQQAGPVLFHCASGNRIGAVLALRAAWRQDVDAEQALQFGLDAGLTRLEGATRQLLGLPDPAATADEAR